MTAPDLEIAGALRTVGTLPDWLTARLVYAIGAEAVTWPKPGLVTAVDSGCHRDMDVYSFLRSASTLQPYFRDAAEFALRHPAVEDLAARFAELRELGRDAEQAMVQATGGANTHRGVIFLGIVLICAAVAAHTHTSRLDPVEVCEAARRISRDALLADLYGAGRSRDSSGMRSFRCHGLLGIRGEVLRRFPNLLESGLPALRAALAAGEDLREALVHTLLSLMCVVEDTTVLNRRSDPTRLWTTQRLAREAIEAGGPGTAGRRRAVQDLCRVFTTAQISPGGSADLTAMALCIHLWDTEVSP